MTNESSTSSGVPDQVKDGLQEYARGRGMDTQGASSAESRPRRSFREDGLWAFIRLDEWGRSAEIARRVALLARLANILAAIAHYVHQSVVLEVGASAGVALWMMVSPIAGLLVLVPFVVGLVQVIVLYLKYPGKANHGRPGAGVRGLITGSIVTSVVAVLAWGAFFWLLI
jgi:hypothetical protein